MMRRKINIVRHSINKNVRGPVYSVKKMLFHRTPFRRAKAFSKALAPSPVWVFFYRTPSIARDTPCWTYRRLRR